MQTSSSNNNKYHGQSPQKICQFAKLRTCIEMCITTSRDCSFYYRFCRLFLVVVVVFFSSLDRPSLSVFIWIACFCATYLVWFCRDEVDIIWLLLLLSMSFARFIVRLGSFWEVFATKQHKHIAYVHRIKETEMQISPARDPQLLYETFIKIYFR